MCGRPSSRPLTPATPASGTGDGDACEAHEHGDVDPGGGTAPADLVPEPRECARLEEGKCRIRGGDWPGTSPVAVARCEGRKDAEREHPAPDRTRTDRRQCPRPQRICARREQEERRAGGDAGRSLESEE